MTFLGLEADETLLIGKIAFLVLLYVFILFVMRSATKGMTQAPQESIVLGAAEANALRAEHGLPPTRLLVLASPDLGQGRTIEVAAPTVVGRDATSRIRLEHDEFASARHARIEPRQDGAWVDDLGSTNGTFVNGTKLEEGKAREGRRRHPDRRDRAAGADVRIGRTAGVTDTGRRRMRNEDALVLRPPLFAVADGMGGARAGEIAARLAAAALEEASTDTMGEKAVSSLIEEANRRIWQRSLADPATAGMGTTVTAALVDATAGTVALGHVGDSRAYRLRGDALEQLSTDHSLVAELVQSGVLTPEEAERHPQRSAITRALGTEPAVEVEVLTVDGEVGDLFLLCSDGLSAMLGDEEIAAAIESAGRDPPVGRRGARRGGERPRRRGQHHGRPLRARRRRGSASDEVAEASDPERRSSRVRAGRSTCVPRLMRTPTSNRHGAGPGGRLAALALIALVVVVGLLALYWGISR